MSTDLCKLMVDHKSDKGVIWHSYTPVYDLLFRDMRHDNINIFEMGLGTNNITIPCNMGAEAIPGASLYAWADYFSKANVYGADIDSDILFHTDRIKTFYCDQLDKEKISAMWAQMPNNMNIIIDDGLHKWKANLCLFENAIQKLANGGYYIIEDIAGKYLKLASEFIREQSVTRPWLNMRLLELFDGVNKHDNNLLIIRNGVELPALPSSGLSRVEEIYYKERYNIMYRFLPQLPEELFGNSNIRELYLSFNLLTELPEEIGQLTQLVKLYANKNMLTKVSDKITNLTKLEHLYLNDNQLQQLPAGLNLMVSLKYFSCNNNPLVVRPDLSALNLLLCQV